jgi:hypothetical protein
MKTIMIMFTTILFLVCVAQAEPQKEPEGKFGMGRGQFGHVMGMGRMRRQLENIDRPNLNGKEEVSVPPKVERRRFGQWPMMPPVDVDVERGPRGPRDPFRRHNLRRGDSKDAVSGYNFDHSRRGWGKKYQDDTHKGHSPKRQKSRSDSKNIKIIILYF